MYNLYMDEKGPQETFKISEPFDKKEKIAYGSDQMHVYAANVIGISKNIISIIEEKYTSIENNFLALRHNLKGKELKGQSILKNNFAYGVASLKDNEITFYRDLFEVLIDNDVYNLFFSISKMSTVIDTRLGNWMLELESRSFIDSVVLLKYSLTKYAEIEASEIVIQKLLDPSVETKELLNEIRKDLTYIIESNKGNKRMETQINEYKKMTKVIKKFNYINNSKSNPIKFDWNKVVFALDLWLTEHKVQSLFDFTDTNLFLDQGIPKTPFEELNLKDIKKDCISRNNVGIRISDVLVALIGNYISKLRIDVLYDFDKPAKIKLLPEKWFDFSESQFELIKLIYLYFLGSNNTYDFVTDTYFDDTVVIESFLQYVSSYSSYSNYRNVSLKIHSTNFLKTFHNNSVYRWKTGVDNERTIKSMYGNYRKGIETGDIRPL